jgi:DNA-binding MarR family transcriptional regulator
MAKMGELKRAAQMLGVAFTTLRQHGTALPTRIEAVNDDPPDWLTAARDNQRKRCAQAAATPRAPERREPLGDHGPRCDRARHRPRRCRRTACRTIGYACLELLGQRPGLSNAELVRGAFVTRQSMILVLRGLQDRGLLTRPDLAPHGRALPTQLTPAGRDQLHTASVAVRAVELQMLAPLLPADQHRLRDDLATCAAALTSPPMAHHTTG